MPLTTQYHPPQEEEALPQEEAAAAAAGRLHPAAGLAPGLHPAAGLAQVDVTVDIPGSLQLAASLVYVTYLSPLVIAASLVYATQASNPGLADLARDHRGPTRHSAPDRSTTHACEPRRGQAWLDTQVSPCHGTRRRRILSDALGAGDS